MHWTALPGAGPVELGEIVQLDERVGRMHLAGRGDAPRRRFVVHTSVEHQFDCHVKGCQARAMLQDKSIQTAASRSSAERAARAEPRRRSSSLAPGARGEERAGMDADQALFV